MTRQDRFIFGSIDVFILTLILAFLAAYLEWV